MVLVSEDAEVELGELELLPVIDESMLDGVVGVVVVSRDKVASGVLPVVPVELPVVPIVELLPIVEPLPVVEPVPLPVEELSFMVPPDELPYEPDVPLDPDEPDEDEPLPPVWA